MRLLAQPERTLAIVSWSNCDKNARSRPYPYFHYISYTITLFTTKFLNMGLDYNVTVMQLEFS